MTRRAQLVRSAFLSEAAAAIIRKATVGGESTLTPDELAFLRVWNAESVFAKGGLDAIFVDEAVGSSLEIAAAYAAVGAPRKAEIVRRHGELPAGARDPRLDDEFRRAKEDGDRLLEKFWVRRSAGARAELARRQSNLPDLVWKLVCWTASGWLVGLLFDQSFVACWWCAALPLAAVAWIAWAVSTCAAAVHQLRYVDLGTRLIIVLMVCASIALQLSLAVNAIAPPSDARLARSFQEHRQDFERLLSMVSEDTHPLPEKPDTFTIDDKFGYRGYSKGVSETRLSEYRRLMAKCGVVRVEAEPTFEMVKFVVYRRGFIGPDSGWSDSIVYSAHAVDLGDPRDRRIDQNWWLHSE